jgi:hypothetical protein
VFLYFGILSRAETTKSIQLKLAGRDMVQVSLPLYFIVGLAQGRIGEPAAFIVVLQVQCVVFVQCLARDIIRKRKGIKR